MKAGTGMDAFKQSYPDDPLAGVRKEVPPKDPEDESESAPAEGDEESEDLADDPGADVDDEAAVDEEAAAAH